MNCDPIAPFYRWIEYFAFGRTLERRRFEFLPEALTARRALILGDGDGRFLAELIEKNPSVEVDCVELSNEMVKLAKRRIGSPSRVLFFQKDARAAEFPHQDYDLIVTHFFLDCFADAEAALLIKRLRAVAKEGALWIVSEFRMPPSGWRAVHASLWLRAMYLFFGIATGLANRRLPRYRDVLEANGFVLQREVEERAGLVGSELWLLNAPIVHP
jgi:ubiquinone/menaquinone biosynthesis C-methylase UbiE